MRGDWQTRRMGLGGVQGAGGYRGARRAAECGRRGAEDAATTAGGSRGAYEGVTDVMRSQ